MRFGGGGLLDTITVRGLFVPILILLRSFG